MTDIPDHLQPDPETLIRSLPNGEAVLLHSSSEVYYGLDPVGLRIWNLIEQYGSLDQVVDQLQAEFEVDPMTLRSDVDSLVAELLERRLLRASME